MKIAYDHQIFSMQRYGGVSRYIFELASRLSTCNGTEISVVAPVHSNTYLAADTDRLFTRGTYVSIQLPAPFNNAINGLASPVTMRRIRPDIVHETYYKIKPVVKAQHHIVTVHDMIHELFVDEFPDVKRAAAAKRAAVNRADHIICVSENSRQDLIHLYDVEPERTTVVHLGSPVHAASAVDHRSTGLGRPSLLYVGHRKGYKNFSALLQAYANSPELQEFELIAFGGPPATQAELYDISRLGLQDRVRFETGSDEKLAAHYSAATAFIYPSKYEGFGIPPLEAMSYGCPVVCSDRGSIPEIVDDAGEYFNPNDVDDLRAAVERVAMSETLQAELRSRGRTRLAAFSWDKCAAATAQVYRTVMN